MADQIIKINKKSKIFCHAVPSHSGCIDPFHLETSMIPIVKKKPLMINLYLTQNFGDNILS